MVTGILQDQKGFIWLSTWNGLDKFDGYNFKNYKAYSGDSCTLSNNRITYISESKYGNIWCLSYDGRSFLFDKEEERFIDVLKPIEEETKTVNVITQIYVLPKGVTWATTNKGATFVCGGYQSPNHLLQCSVGRSTIYNQ